jgi:hypothetical protein
LTVSVTLRIEAFRPSWMIGYAPWMKPAPCAESMSPPPAARGPPKFASAPNSAVFSSAPLESPSDPAPAPAPAPCCASAWI